MSGSCLPAPADSEGPGLLIPAVTQAHGGGPCALSNQGRVSRRRVGHCKAPACTFLLTEASVVLVGRVPSMVPGGSSAGFLAPFVTPIYTGRGGRWKDSGRPRKPGNGECVGSGAEAGNGAGLKREEPAVAERPLRGHFRSRWTQVHWCSAGTSVHPARSVGAEPAAGPPGVLCSHCARRLRPRSLSWQLCARSPASPQMVW